LAKFCLPRRIKTNTYYKTVPPFG